MAGVWTLKTTKLKWFQAVRVTSQSERKGNRGPRGVSNFKFPIAPEDTTRRHVSINPSLILPIHTTLGDLLIIIRNRVLEIEEFSEGKAALVKGYLDRRSGKITEIRRLK